VAWCAKELGVEVSYKKLYDWFRRWGCLKKVPRAMAEKGDAQAQEVWRRGAIGSLIPFAIRNLSEWRGVLAAASP
jgi:hypothetical protein